MKKSIALLLSLFLLTGLAAGCGSSSAEPDVLPTSSAEIPAAAETAAETTEEASAEAVETTAAPEVEEDPLLGLWLCIYVDAQGFKIPTGRDQGMAIDVLLEEDGKASYLVYLEDDEDTEVEARWAVDGDGYLIESDDPEMAGTFHFTVSDGVLTIEEFPSEGTVMKYAKPDTQAEADLRAEAQMVQDILDEIDAETAERDAP